MVGEMDCGRGGVVRRWGGRGIGKVFLKTCWNVCARCVACVLQRTPSTGRYFYGFLTTCHSILQPLPPGGFL